MDQSSKGHFVSAAGFRPSLSCNVGPDRKRVLKLFSSCTISLMPNDSSVLALVETGRNHSVSRGGIHGTQTQGRRNTGPSAKGEGPRTRKTGHLCLGVCEEDAAREKRFQPEKDFEHLQQQATGRGRKHRREL